MGGPRGGHPDDAVYFDNFIRGKANANAKVMGKGRGRGEKGGECTQSFDSLTTMTTLIVGI